MDRVKEEKMELRRYRIEDTEGLQHIYYNTIHNINKRDYTPEELEVWAPSGTYTQDKKQKDIIRFTRINPFVVAEDDFPLGFAELEEKGHINCFFVHDEHGGRGIGSMLLKACETEAKQLGYNRMFAEVSITAKPFFQKKGFKVIKPILCDIKGLKMKYYEMEKLI